VNEHTVIIENNTFVELPSPLKDPPKSLTTILAPLDPKKRAYAMDCQNLFHKEAMGVLASDLFLILLQLRSQQQPGHQNVILTF